MSSVADFPQQLILLFKEEALDLLGQWENSCIALQQHSKKSDWDQLFNAVHSIKGSVQTLGLHYFSEYLASIESFLAESSTDIYSTKQLQILFEAQSKGIEWVTNIEMLDDVSIKDEVIAISSALDNTVTNSKNDEALTNTLIDKSNIDLQQSHITLNKMATNKKYDLHDSVKISGKSIDKILDQLNEIKTHQSILENHFISGEASVNLAKQSLAISQSRIRELQRQVSHLRSVNAEVVFKRVVRAVTEANLALDKNVQLELEGHLVKIDKSLADQIVSSLIHIVRNCVDHGIEASSERAKLGKNIHGVIKLSVIRRLKHIEISVKDDGSGIDTTLLIEKALSKGVIRETPTVIDNKLILQILCSPGFSTTTNVTEISGRGVGMNAVSEKIIAMGGQMTLTYENNVGTEFTILVPNSITSIKAIVVSIDNYKIAIPINEIIEVCQFNEQNIEADFGNSKIKFKDDIIKYFSLSGLINRYTATHDKQTEYFGLICGNGLSKTAYGVNSILGQQEVVVRPLEPKLTDLPGCQGAAYFSDGSPGLVLSLNKLEQGNLDEVLH